MVAGRAGDWLVDGKPARLPLAWHVTAGQLGWGQQSTHQAVDLATGSKEFCSMELKLAVNEFGNSKNGLARPGQAWPGQARPGLTKPSQAWPLPGVAGNRGTSPQPGNQACPVAWLAGCLATG